MIKEKDIRIPVGDGVIYPKEASELESVIRAELDSVETIIDSKRSIKAVIVPSVAYKYSLPLLSKAFKHLEGRGYDEIFLFSDPIMHTLDFLAFAQHRHWQTPVGTHELSHRAKQIVQSDDSERDLMRIDDSKHLGEVSIESQLPFLSITLQNHFKIIPFMHGNVSPRVSSNLIEKFVDQDDLIVCISSLSSGMPDTYGNDIDLKTIEAITSLDLKFLDSDTLEVTSPNSVRTVCNIASLRGWKVESFGYEIVSISNANRTHKIGIAGFVMYE